MSRVALLDVSVLVALFNGGHTHHQVAHDWFGDNCRSGWATCPLTENGLLRVLGNSTRVGHHVPLPQLVPQLNKFCASQDHHFWPDTVSVRDSELFNVSLVRGHQQITDVYLLGLAVKHGGRFVTFDNRVQLGAVKGATRASLEVIAPAV